MKNKDLIISEIADELDCGKICYLNPKTGELIAIPDFKNSWPDDELEELFQDDLEKIRANQKDYIKFETLKSFESFGIMAEFVEQMVEIDLKMYLLKVLSKKKPFRNFKNTVDRSNFREDWFRFKGEAIKKIVLERLENESEIQD